MDFWWISIQLGMSCHPNWLSLHHFSEGLVETTNQVLYWGCKALFWDLWDLFLGHPKNIQSQQFVRGNIGFAVFSWEWWWLLWWWWWWWCRLASGWWLITNDFLLFLIQTLYFHHVTGGACTFKFRFPKILRRWNRMKSHEIPWNPHPRAWWGLPLPKTRQFLIGNMMISPWTQGHWFQGSLGWRTKARSRRSRGRGNWPP
jgi:hypothetical protein